MNIYTPVASIAASIRYVRDRYHVAADGSDLASKVQQLDPNRHSAGYWPKGGCPRRPPAAALSVPLGCSSSDGFGGVRFEPSLFLRNSRLDRNRGAG